MGNKREKLSEGQLFKRLTYEILVKGLLAGTVAGAAHLFVLTMLRKKFDTSA